MENYFANLVPQLYDNFKTMQGDYCIVLNKRQNVCPLRKILDYYTNNIDDKHVAWIITRLQNICCLLQYNNLVHNGISLDNCFISPSDHSIYLYGGRWYATDYDAAMIGTQKCIYDVMPIIAKTKKISNPITDLESVKLLARQLLGDANCRTLSSHTKAPKALIDFLINGSSDDAFNELVKWGKALHNSFGERKFIKMELDENKIYEKNKEN